MEKDITDRIEMILKAYDLSPSGFSDLIQVQRSAMSHIFSRRNRPSLDVIQKVLKQFPEINSNWLLTGIGKMKQLNLFDEDSSAQKDLKKKEMNVSQEVKNPAPPKTETIKEISFHEPYVSSNPLPASVFESQVPKPIFAPQNSPIDHGFRKEGLFNKNPDTENPAGPWKEEPNYIQTQDRKEEAKPDSLPPIKEVSKEVVPEKPREKEIDKIIIFYKDKTFSSYTPE